MSVQVMNENEHDPLPIRRDHLNFSPPPENSEEYPPDMLPPLSCPRLADRPRELRQMACFLLSLFLLATVIAILIWLSGWVEGDFEMTSVYSTRELRPVPKLLVEMVKDPSSLSVTYHGRRGKERGGERDEQREGAWKGEDPSQPTTDPPLTLLVLADSQPDNVNLRRAVRGSWMKYPCVGTTVTVVFTVAAKGLSSDKLLQLEREAQKHKDLAMFPGSSSLPESEHLLYQLGWAEDTFSYHYLLRTKDRFYVRLPEIVNKLQDTDPHSNIYWGYFEGNRLAKKRWSGKQAEPDWFLCNKFIRFAHSGGYIISQPLVHRLVQAADYLQLYQNEDIGLATWLSPFGDVTWKHDIQFDTDIGQSRGCLNSFLIFPVNSCLDMLRRYERLTENGQVCRKEHSLVTPHSFDFFVLPSQCCPTI